MTDWHAWHAEYADPASPLSQRLRAVQSAVAGWLDDHPAVPVDVLSLCAGHGRDIVEVLSARTDAGRVSVTLVELDVDLARRARDLAAHAGLSRVEVRSDDAGATASFADRLPCDLLLVCGVFGNVSDRDIERTVAALPAMVRPGGTVIWTRSRRRTNLTPSIRSWLDAAGFAERAFVAPDGVLWSVGVHERVTATPAELPERLFRFER